MVIDGRTCACADDSLGLLAPRLRLFASPFPLLRALLALLSPLSVLFFQRTQEAEPRAPVDVPVLSAGMTVSIQGRGASDCTLHCISTIPPMGDAACAVEAVVLPPDSERFLIELEFVQNLANVGYLNCNTLYPLPIADCVLQLQR